MADFLIKLKSLREHVWSEAAAPALADGAARLKVERFALTANNVTYATFGEAMGYWNFFPAADPAYGRVPVWGFATVTDSKAEGVRVGARVYGYLPISEYFDVTPVRAGSETFMDGAAHRQGLAPIYNTYVFTSADPSYDAKLEAEQMLFRPLFTTGFMIDDCLMEAGAAVPETVLISSASSKTALALAHCLKQRGGVEAVALTSAANKAYVEGLGLYARVTTYDEADQLHARGLTAFVDFLGRPSLTADVHNALRDRLARSLVIGVTDWEGNRAPINLPDPQPEMFFVPTYAAARAKALGPEVLNARLGAAMRGFYGASSKYLTPLSAAGRAAIESGWRDTLDARVPPSKGLVLSF
jgi:NADPH:quinone reductase-like Zn-dependent oxidoreductase